MEVLTPQNQSSDDWHQLSLDESWDSHLPTPLKLDLSIGEEELTSYTNGDSENLCPDACNDQRDSGAKPDSHNEFVELNDLWDANDTEYLKMARKGGGHADLLAIEPHTPTCTSGPVNYKKKDGQWYAHSGVDVKDTQQRKEMMTVSSRPSMLDSSVDIETDTNYLKIAKKGGGHKDLLIIDAHTPSPEPVKYDKKDGQWYIHDGVDVQDTLQCKEMATVSSRPSALDTSVDIETDTDYLKIAKKGGGHKDLLTVTAHTPTPEPLPYDKTDGQWYTHDGVDVKETQMGNNYSLNLGSVNNNENITAAGGRSTEYLDLAKKGGGHKDLLTVTDHVSSPKPLKYKKIGGEWYNQDDMVIKDGPQDTGEVKKRHRTYSDSAADSKAETEYLRTARRGGGQKDLLILEAHVSSPEPVKVDKKDGQWYTHDGVDVRETQGRKEMVTLPNSPRPSSMACSVKDIETDTDYLKIAKKGGGHKDLLTVEPHTPTPEPVKYDKTDGRWYTHDGVDVKETQSRRDLTASLGSCLNDDDVVAAGQIGGEYLKLAKKGGGHKDLLMIEPHTPTQEPVTCNKEDGQWYTHDGVDVKDTQQRKEMVTVGSSPRSSNLDSSLEVETDTKYLKIAKRGGGHKDLLTVEPHTPTPKPVKYDKTDGQWYTHDGVDVKETQQRKELAVSVSDQSRIVSEVAAGANNTDYLDLAKKGGGHRDLLTVEPHTPTPEPVKYDKTDGQWYPHDGVDVKETQQRRDISCTLDSTIEDLTAAGENNGEYLQVAKKGGRKDLLTVEPHTPTPEPVKYDKTDGEWYTHDGVDVNETHSRREMATVASSPRPSNAVNVNTDTEYLTIAKKGGGHKDLLTIEPHTPTLEPVKYDKTDGQWYTHEGVDVKGTQSRKEMATVCTSPRSPNAVVSSAAVSSESDYLKMAKKGGGHKDLLTVEPHTTKQEPVKYEKKDGQWYSHDGVDVKETQQRKEMVTVSNNSPSPSNVNASRNVQSDTEYLKLATKGGGHKDLLTIEPHTPSPEPKKYKKNGGDWFSQDVKEIKESPVQPSPQQSNSSDSDYLKIARKGGGHGDLLTVTPHTLSPEPVKYDKKDGHWYSHDGVDVKETQQRKDLLSVEAHTPSPSPEPKRYEKKGGEWYSQDSVDGEKSKRNKGSSSSLSPREVNTETEYLRTARKGGGHKDLLTIEHHKSSPKPKKQERKLGDWYYHGHDEAVVKDSRAPTSGPNNSASDSSRDSDYLGMARKAGSHRDVVMMTPQTASPKPRQLQRNGVSSPRNGMKKDSTDYLRLARKGGGHPDLLSSAPRQSSSPAVDTSSTVDELQRKDPIIQDSPLRRSASMRHPSRSTGSDYLSIARKGGHHKDLLTMPEGETSNFKRDQASRRSLRSFRSPWTAQVDGPARSKTADLRLPQPIWLGGSGPERVHSPGKRFINQGAVVVPFACHEGCPGAAKNPDKI